jgi:hypothetical protein
MLARPYLVVPMTERELLLSGWDALLIGPLLTGPWLMPLGEYVPVERTRLPYISRWVETPDCASAELPQAIRQRILRVALMGPRERSGQLA